MGAHPSATATPPVAKPPFPAPGASEGGHAVECCVWFFPAIAAVGFYRLLFR